ncbi:MAG: tetratricopeptide repeat protein [Planctomycetota bacterium]|jgi:type II secretory pathway component HofQ
MKSSIGILAGIFLLLLAPGEGRAGEPDAQTEFEKGFYKEQAERDLSGAVSVYAKIVARHDAARAIIAKALFRMGSCLERLGKAKEAREAFDRIVREFKDQKSVAAQAQKALRRLNASTEKPAHRPEGAGDPDRKRILATLQDEKISLDFRDASLADVVAFIRAARNVNIVVDPQVLHHFEDEGRKVNIQVNDLNLKEGLNLLMQLLGLDWTIHKKVIFISTLEKIAELRQTNRIQAKMDVPVSLDFMDTPFPQVLSFLHMVSQINFVLDPHLDRREDELFVQVRVTDIPLREALNLVLGLKELKWAVLHRTVFIAEEEALAAYRSLKWPSPADRLSPRERGIWKTLKNKIVSINFPNTSLKDALAFLTSVSGVNLVVDPGVLKALKKDDRSLSFNLKDMPIESALRLICMSLGLTYRVEKGFVAIVSRRGKSPIGGTPAGQPGKGIHGTDPHEQRIRSILAKESISLDFKDAPLADVVDFLRQTKGINIVADPKTLENFEKEGRTINLQVEDLNFGDAIQLILRFNSLDSAILHHVLYLGDPQALARYASLKWFGVPGGEPGGGLDPRWKKKISLDVCGKPLHPILKFLEAESGMAFTLSPAARKIAEREVDHIVVEDLPVGEALEKFLQPYALGYAVRPGGIWIATPEELAAEGAGLLGKDRQIVERLGKKCITLDLMDTPLSVTTNFLREVSSINMFIHPSVQEMESNTGLSIRLRADDIPLDSALRLILMPHGLTYRVEHGAILIESRAGATGNRAGKRPIPLWTGKSEESPDGQRVRSILGKETLSLNFQDAPLKDVTDFIRATKNLNIVVDPKVLGTFENEERTITLQLEKMILRDAIGVLLWFTGLECAFQNQVLYFTTSEELARIRSQEASDGGEEKKEPESPIDRAILKRLRTKTISLDFLDTPLLTVLNFIREAGAIANIVVAPAVARERSEDELRIDLKVDEISLEKALRLILSPRGLTFRVTKGVVLIDVKREGKGK